MIEYKIDKNGVKCEASGSLEKICAETLYMVNLIYTRLIRHQPALGRAFRAAIIAGITSPLSPVFQDNGDVGSCQDILIVRERET
mgnify:CR=1 FL=1